MLLLTLGDSFECFAPLNISLRLARIKGIHVLFVVEPFLFGEVTVESDGSQGASRGVRPVKQRLGRAEQVREEVVRLPYAVSARDVHCRRSYFHCIAVAVLDWPNQATVLLFHVSLHYIVVGVHLLADRSVDIAEILRADQVELRFALPHPVRLDQGDLVPIVFVLDIAVDRGDPLLQLALLMQRWQERNFFAHLGEFE